MWTPSTTGRARRLVSSLTAASVLAAATLVGLGTSTAGAAPAVPLSTGSNQYGQLGVTGTSQRLVPGEVGLPAVVGIASGRDHAYALGADGSVWAWGENGDGQIGDGTRTNRSTPVRLALTDVVAVEAGHYHGLALRSDGTVWTWGYNSLGQLGLGDTARRTTPTRIPGLTGITQVAGGRDMSYAVRADGSVLGWGSNALGEAGDGTTTRRLSPVPVVGLTGVVEISGGRNHGLARTSTGEVWAWGDNAYGQLGDGTTTRRLSPVRVVTSGVRHVDAGAHHSISVSDAGVVQTWGRGYRGQLGLGGTSGRTRPTTVPGLPPAVEIGDGRDQSFAITEAGEVWAWGQNSSGQLGDGTTTRRTSPVKLALTGILAAQSGSAHTIFLPGAEGEPPPNRPPVASFTSTCTGLSCSFDSAASSDADGTIVSRSWAFGDGGAAEGTTAAHEFADGGSYPVSLTVTDDAGASATLTRQVTVADVAPSKVAFRAAATRSVNSASASVQVPAGVQPGDALLLFVTTNVVRPVTVPAGWTLVGADVHSYRSDVETRLYARVAPVGAAGSSVVVGLSATTKIDLTLLAYSGTSSSPIAAWASREEPTATAAHTTPAVDVPPPGGWVVSYWAEKSSTTTDWAAPAGHVQRSESIGSGSGRIVSLSTDSGAPLPAGTVPGSTAVANSSGRKAIMFSVVLRPA